MAADGQTGHCRRLAAETKGGKGTKWFPCPLLPLSVGTDTPGPPKACLSRAAAGIRGKSLIVNLPGSPKGACENLEAVLEPLEHGIFILRGGKE